MSQRQTPLVNQLKILSAQKDAPFYTPGHKKGKATSHELKQLMGEKVFRADLPELPELDNLFAPEGVIKEAQGLASLAFGADYTWFLANGTTCGIIASLLAICKEGDEIILPRNVHQSAIYALILTGAIPIFINPEYNSDFDLCYTISPSQIINTLQRHPSVKAIFIVSPTYQGICANLGEIAYISHNHNIPLIVDEAHGAHFHFHPLLPLSALSTGADIVIQSTHKVLGAMTQASMLHLQGNLVSEDKIRQALPLTQSSSPNYLLLASLDSARQQMATEGQKLLNNTLNLAQQARESLGKLSYLQLLRFATPTDSYYDLDLTRLTVNVTQFGLTGYECDRTLSEEFGVICELPTLTNLTFIISIGNDLEDIERLINSFQQISKYQKSAKIKANFQISPPPPSQLKMTPRQAFQREKISKNIPSAINCISGETIIPYPPGIPVIMAGEIITPTAIDYINQIISHGGIVTGMSDVTLETIKIIS